MELVVIWCCDTLWHVWLPTNGHDVTRVTLPPCSSSLCLRSLQPQSVSTTRGRWGRGLVFIFWYYIIHPFIFYKPKHAVIICCKYWCCCFPWQQLTDFGVVARRRTRVNQIFVFWALIFVEFFFHSDWKLIIFTFMTMKSLQVINLLFSCLYSHHGGHVLFFTSV